MEREILRERVLPAFSIGIVDLEELFRRIAALFEHPAGTEVLITVRAGAEIYTFDSVESLRQWKGVKNWVTHFSFWLAEGVGTVAIISASPPFESKAKVRVTGATEWWCSEVAEEVYSFLKTRKVGHYWLAGAPRRWILLLVFPILNMGAVALFKGFMHNPIILIGWPTTTLALAAMVLFRDRFFPPCILRVGVESNLVRRYGAKLILAVTLLSLAVNLTAWYLPEEQPADAAPASYGPAFIHIETPEPQAGQQQNQDGHSDSDRR